MAKIEHIYERKIYQEILQWKQERNGSTALLIKGARRIGKSTVAEEFARNEYETYIIIDFAKSGREIYALFDDVNNLDFLFLRLQTIFNVVLKPRKSVIIFDEVQLCPAARQAIKFLVADGRYDYIETGSLMSLRKFKQGIIIPSEETRINMYPLDFEEFLNAIGESTSFAMIKYAFDNKISVGEAVHRKLMRLFRLYMLVGGMPQAINAYLDTNNLSAVDKVKREIIELYIDDLREIDSSGRASRIFKSVPGELSRGKLRYQVGSILENAGSMNLDEVWEDLENSLTVNFVYRCHDPNVGMGLHRNIDFFKLYLGDTGLFVTLAFWDNDKRIKNTLYDKILSDKLSADLGYVYENVVAQSLVAAGRKPCYYIFKADAEGKTHYEVDFIIGDGVKLMPIEVKSSGYRTHKSLDEFKKKYSDRISGSVLIYTKDLKKEGDMLYLPVYMTSLL